MIPFATFTPVLAAGAVIAAVGVPLLIHLLFRKRYQIVPWAAIRFLLVAERRHRRRIDQWLLLALRALALLLPLFAMIAATKWAEPLWQAIRPGATESIDNVPRTHHVIVLDASLSMTARSDDGQTRFEKAVAQAENLIRSGEPGDGYTLIVLAGGVESVVPGPSNDSERVVAELRKVKPTHGPADTAAALSQVADILARSPREYPRRQLTFFTDLQRSAWANALPKSDATQSPKVWQRIFRRTDDDVIRADVVVVDVARTDLDNLAVADVSLADSLPMVDSPAFVNATIANFGRTEKRNVRVQLLIGRPSSGSETLASIEELRIDTIPPGERTKITFGRERPIRFLEKGIHVFQVKLVDGDELPADDMRTLAVQVRDGLHVILVDGSNDPEWKRRAAGYLSRALFPPDAKPSDTPARPRTMTPNEFLDPAVGDLTGIDCVYLCDLPTPNSDLAAKLEALLKRGGSVVIGLGPNAAANRADYNRVLFNDGNGLLPGPLGDLVSPASADDLGYRLAAEEDAYRRPPLRLFLDESIRGGLIMAPFTSYIRLDTPPDGRARRIMSFVPAKAPTTPDSRKPDAALIEWNRPRDRGRVIVYASSFNEDWNHWPPLPSYLPFQDQLLRYAATNPDRHTILVGEAIEEFYPPAVAGLKATLTGPEALSGTIPLVTQDEGAVARFGDTRLSGLYRLRLDGQPDRTFAVNVPEIVPGVGSESDLKRIEPSELKALGPVQVVADVADAKPSAESGAVFTSEPKRHGPMIARFAVLFALAILALETFLAWRWGPSRAIGAGTAAGSVRTVDRKWYLRLLSTTAALLPLAVALAALFVIVHYNLTGNLLGFLPENVRHEFEVAAGVPAAQPGEGTKWRLEGLTAFVRNGITDRRLIFGLAAVGLVLFVAIYRMERRAVSGYGRLVVPGLLRLSVFLLALFVLLPQLQLAFDREGWPEVVILIDSSGSMGHIDDFKDPAVRAKAEELVGASGLSQAQRLRLAQLLLTRKDSEWLNRLLKEKEVKVRIYLVDSTQRQIAQLNQPSDAAEGSAAIMKLSPDGESSRLGECVEKVLKDYRGGSLAAIIMFTDGVTTAGDNLPQAASEASRAGVPLFLIGVGDAWETPDLELIDLQAEDTVTVGDRLVFDARLAAHGQVPPDPLPIVLYEKIDGQLVERSRTLVTPGSDGNRVPVTVAYTPMEPGEKTFVLVAPTVPGETNTTNNRLERTVIITDSKRVRVLYVEGYPRYDFRFVKVLLERESERSVGGKGVEVKVVLLNAAKGWEGIDKTALAVDAFPTREELFGYDVVVLGDVDPKHLPRGNRALQDLADFVRVKGGGLLFLSGEHGTPFAYVDTPLAEILPVIPAESAQPRNDDDSSLTEEYRPRLTPAGQQHPLFRFSPDVGESANIWSRLQPLYWYAKGYRRKPNTVVLAEHPNRVAEGGLPGEKHPLLIQAFVGAGPVLFFGFDDTWRWRYRNDEEHFDRFWIQAVRMLSRARVRRVELKVSPKELRQDEKMTVVVRFPIEAPAPPDGQSVRVTLVHTPPRKPGGKSSDPVSTLFTLTRAQGPAVLYEMTLPRTPEGEYRFTLTNPETPAGQSPPTAVARVLPPLNEMDRVELNKPDLAAAAAVSNGGFYTLATADNVFDDLKNLPRVRLKQPCDPVELWNHYALYLLIVLLLAAEWLLRKRERLL